MGATVNTAFIDHFSNDWFLLSDFTDLFVGAHIGQGTSRSVYEYRLNPKWIIKIDRSGQFCNVSEWDIWHNYKHIPEYAKFLAPCIHLSSCGRVMIQERTKPVKNIKDLPKEIPNFFSDFKIQNWGMIGKRFVCHDYANHRLFAPDKVLMFEPEWWSDTWQQIHEPKEELKLVTIDNFSIKP